MHEQFSALECWTVLWRKEEMKAVNLFDIPYLTLLIALQFLEYKHEGDESGKFIRYSLFG